MFERCLSGCPLDLLIILNKITNYGFFSGLVYTPIRYGCGVKILRFAHNGGGASAPHNTAVAKATVLYDNQGILTHRVYDQKKICLLNRI